MPIVRIAPDLQMHYLVDDYTDPWRDAETILMLHGNAESGAVWFGWVPHLARHFRVIRPDMRGFGESTPMPRDYAWSLDVLVDDYRSLMHTLGIERFHLVGAKLGGAFACHFAARYPGCVRTLTLAGTPPPRRDMATEYSKRKTEFEEQGVEHWARRTIANRLGSAFPPDGVEWWIQLMGRTAVSTLVGFIASFTKWDIASDLPCIRCPTLVITTEENRHHGSLEQTRAWQQMIPRSTLLALPGDSFHVAASDPDRCADAMLAFIANAAR